MQSVLLKIKSLPVCFSANLWIKACRVYLKAAVSGVTSIGDHLEQDLYLCQHIHTTSCRVTQSANQTVFCSASLRRVRKNPHGGNKSSERRANRGARILCGGCSEGRATNAEASETKNPGGRGLKQPSETPPLTLPRTSRKNPSPTLQVCLYNLSKHVWRNSGGHTYPPGR